VIEPLNLAFEKTKIEAAITKIAADIDTVFFIASLPVKSFSRHRPQSSDSSGTRAKTQSCTGGIQNPIRAGTEPG